MKTYEECLRCFVDQAKRVARIAGLDPSRSERVIDRVRERTATYPADESPVRMAAEIHQIIRDEGGDQDPFRTAKRTTDEVARRLIPLARRWIDAASDGFDAAVRMAIAGNLIDYGARDRVTEQDVEAAMRHAMEAPLFGASGPELERAVNQSGRILFIGDNSAECHFDRLLLERFPPGRTAYAVRGGPVLNDATREDAEAAGIGEFARIIDTGDAAPGVLLDRCSPGFAAELAGADLVLAKGQGNYESLSNAISATHAFLLKAKCPVVARDVGCNVGDIILLLAHAGQARSGDPEEGGRCRTEVSAE